MKSEIYHMLIAGLSGGFIRIRMMMMKGEKLNIIKVVMELATAAISAYYLGDLLITLLPEDYKWSDNFIHFITGYGGMNLVDLIYKRFTKK